MRTVHKTGLAAGGADQMLEAGFEEVGGGINHGVSAGRWEDSQPAHFSIQRRGPLPLRGAQGPLQPLFLMPFQLLSEAREWALSFFLCQLKYFTVKILIMDFNFSRLFFGNDTGSIS